MHCQVSIVLIFYWFKLTKNIKFFLNSTQLLVLILNCIKNEEILNGKLHFLYSASKKTPHQVQFFKWWQFLFPINVKKIKILENYWQKYLRKTKTTEKKTSFLLNKIQEKGWQPNLRFLLPFKCLCFSLISFTLKDLRNRHDLKILLWVTFFKAFKFPLYDYFTKKNCCLVIKNII